MKSELRDPQAAELGRKRMDWAARWAQVLARVHRRMKDDGSVRGRRLAVVLPVEPKTALLCALLSDAGANVTLVCRAALVQDDVAAALAQRGVTVLARSDSTADDERRFFEAALSERPEVIIDDRAELIRMAHTTHTEALEELIGGSEETTSGVIALRAMEQRGDLRIPCIAANDARSKYLFDNRYGSGQSVIQAIMNATNLLIAGRIVLVLGYGWVGKGIAQRVRGLGAIVLVSEVDPFAALEAHHDGFTVVTVEAGCAEADIVITATGCRRSLDMEVIAGLRDGTILANAGGIDDEFDMEQLTSASVAVRELRDHVVEYELAPERRVIVIGDGKVVNLSAGEGHPIEIMDLSFAVQALSARQLLLHGREMKPVVHRLPNDIDETIAWDRLEVLGIHINRLSPEQQAFLTSWEVPQ